MLRWTLSATVLIFLALELWRPCYFLTDDNLSCSWPALVELGRHLHDGRSAFYSDYLFGGHYYILRDMSFVVWHPFVLGVSLLADTAARFWMIDVLAFLLFAVTVVGFTLLACRLRDEFSLAIPDGYIIFYTLSFVFSTFILTVGPSWIGFLATQSCLPWLTLAIMEERPLRGTALVALFMIHQLLLGYLGLLVSVTLCLSVFALFVARARRSIRPLFCWVAGYILALLILTPLFLIIMNGFGQSSRIHGMSLEDITVFSVPFPMFVSSFFTGNWTELLTRWHGDPGLTTLGFPYLPTILACPAAWCVWPALFSRGRWGYLEKFCLGLALVLVLFVVRPHALAVIMQHLPVFRSLRWPFREGLLFLFYIHLFLILRFRDGPPRWQKAATIFSILAFALPLPFIRPPSLNPLALDRRLLFSGEAEAFWAKAKNQIQPGDQVATVIAVPYWEMNAGDIPYSMLGTANFPCVFRLPCISGYSVTPPADQVPLKTVPYFWFGAFSEVQVPAILAERPDLRLIRITSTHPLVITISKGDGPPVNLPAAEDSSR